MYMKDVIQDSLDDLASSKSSINRQRRALNTLERLLAEICVTAHTGSSDSLQAFTQLQDSFQCNVPFRLLFWISKTLPRLNALTSTLSMTKEIDPELLSLVPQVSQAVSIIQGVSLLHTGSKSYLGRRYPLEVLLELLWISRRLPALPSSHCVNDATTPTSERNSPPSSIPLGHTILDTFSCILVDSPPTLRTFEELNGVQILVKMFKRPATPQEVKIKCIEFLYLYLLDEQSSPATDSTQAHWEVNQLAGEGNLYPSRFDIVPTAPSSPTQTSHRSALSISQLSDSSVSSFDSCKTTSTAVSDSTSATSASSRRSSVSSGSPSPLAPSPLISGKAKHNRTNSLQPLSLNLLKKESVSLALSPSPRKAQIAKLGVGTPRAASRLKLQPIDSNVLSSDDADHEDSSTSSLASRMTELQTPRQIVSRPQATSLGPLVMPTTPTAASATRGHRRAQSSVEAGFVTPLRPTVTSLTRAHDLGKSVLPPAVHGTRSHEEKKAFLGTMLGNVDGLVENIKKTGIFGLG